MMRSLIRTITIIFLLMSIGICTGMNGIPLVGGIVSLCAWLTVRDIGAIGGWVVLYAFCISTGWYDQWGVCFLAIIAAAYAFHFLHTHLKRSHNNSMTVLFAIALVMALCVYVLINIIYTQHIGYNLYTHVVTITASGAFFIIFVWILQKSERFIDLYVHDARGHR